MRRWLSLTILLLASAASAAGLDASNPDVGPVKADGMTDDLPALKRACAMASEQKRRLDLPAGRIRLVAPMTLSGAIPVTGPLDIVGEGRDETVLAVEPSADRGDLGLFGIPAVFAIPASATGCGVALSGLTATCSGDPTTAENRALIYQKGPAANDIKTWLRVRDVATSGGWTTPFMVDSGAQVTGTKVEWTFRDCDIGSKYNCIFFYGLPERSRYLDAQGCTFTSGTEDGRGNCLYISPQCAIKIIGCDFRRNWRCALKYAGVSAAGTADYGIISDCTFSDCHGAGIETDKFSTCLISGCTFGAGLDRAIVHFGGVSVSGCVSYARAFLSTSGASATDPLITVRDCRLIGCTQVMAGGATDQWIGTRWTFSGLDIKGGDNSTATLFNVNRDESVYINDCRIDAANMQAAIVPNGGDWTVRDTEITGVYRWGAIGITKAPKSFDVRNCRIAPAGGKAVFWTSVADGMPANVICGRGNRKVGPLSEIRVQANPVLEQDWRDDSGTLVPFASSTGSLP
jgi:hypothetical protein